MSRVLDLKKVLTALVEEGSEEDALLALGKIRRDQHLYYSRWSALRWDGELLHQLVRVVADQRLRSAAVNAQPKSGYTPTSSGSGYGGGYGSGGLGVGGGTGDGGGIALWALRQLLAYGRCVSETELVLLCEERRDIWFILADTALRLALEAADAEGPVALLSLLIAEFGVSATEIFEIGCTLLTQLPASGVSEGAFVSLLHLAAASYDPSLRSGGDCLSAALNFFVHVAPAVVASGGRDYALHRCEPLFSGAISMMRRFADGGFYGQDSLSPGIGFGDGSSWYAELLTEEEAEDAAAAAAEGGDSFISGEAGSWEAIALKIAGDGVVLMRFLASFSVANRDWIAAEAPWLPYLVGYVRRLDCQESLAREIVFLLSVLSAGSSGNGTYGSTDKDGVVDNGPEAVRRWLCDEFEVSALCAVARQGKAQLNEALLELYISLYESSFPYSDELVRYVIDFSVFSGHTRFVRLVLEKAIAPVRKVTTSYAHRILYGLPGEVSAVELASLECLYRTTFVLERTFKAMSNATVFSELKSEILRSVEEAFVRVSPLRWDPIFAPLLDTASILLRGLDDCWGDLVLSAVDGGLVAVAERVASMTVALEAAGLHGTREGLSSMLDNGDREGLSWLVGDDSAISSITMSSKNGNVFGIPEVLAETCESFTEVNESLANMTDAFVVVPATATSAVVLATSFTSESTPHGTAVTSAPQNRLGGLHSSASTASLTTCGSANALSETTLTTSATNITHLMSPGANSVTSLAPTTGVTTSPFPSAPRGLRPSVSTPNFSTCASPPLTSTTSATGLNSAGSSGFSLSRGPSPALTRSPSPCHFVSSEHTRREVVGGEDVAARAYVDFARTIVVRLLENLSLLKGIVTQWNTLSSSTSTVSSSAVMSNVANKTAENARRILYTAAVSQVLGIEAVCACIERSDELPSLLWAIIRGDDANWVCPELGKTSSWALTPEGAKLLGIGSRPGGYHTPSSFLGSVRTIPGMERKSIELLTLLIAARGAGITSVDVPEGTSIPAGSKKSSKTQQSSNTSAKTNGAGGMVESIAYAYWLIAVLETRPESLSAALSSPEFGRAPLRQLDTDPSTNLNHSSNSHGSSKNRPLSIHSNFLGGNNGASYNLRSLSAGDPWADMAPHPELAAAALSSLIELAAADGTVRALLWWEVPRVVFGLIRHAPFSPLTAQPVLCLLKELLAGEACVNESLASLAATAAATPPIAEDNSVSTSAQRAAQGIISAAKAAQGGVPGLLAARTEEAVVVVVIRCLQSPLLHLKCTASELIFLIGQRSPGLVYRALSRLEVELPLLTLLAEVLARLQYEASPAGMAAAEEAAMMFRKSSSSMTANTHLQGTGISSPITSLRSSSIAPTGPATVSALDNWEGNRFLDGTTTPGGGYVPVTVAMATSKASAGVARLQSTQRESAKLVLYTIKALATLAHHLNLRPAWVPSPFSMSWEAYSGNGSFNNGLASRPLLSAATVQLVILAVRHATPAYRLATLSAALSFCTSAAYAVADGGWNVSAVMEWRAVTNLQSALAIDALPALLPLAMNLRRVLGDRRYRLVKLTASLAVGSGGSRTGNISASVGGAQCSLSNRKLTVATRLVTMITSRGGMNAGVIDRRRRRPSTTAASVPLSTTTSATQIKKNNSSNSLMSSAAAALSMNEDSDDDLDIEGDDLFDSLTLEEITAMCPITSGAGNTSRRERLLESAAVEIFAERVVEAVYALLCRDVDRGVAPLTTFRMTLNARPHAFSATQGGLATGASVVVSAVASAMAGHPHNRAIQRRGLDVLRCFAECSIGLSALASHGPSALLVAAELLTKVGFNSSSSEDGVVMGAIYAVVSAVTSSGDSFGVASLVRSGLPLALTQLLRSSVRDVPHQALAALVSIAQYGDCLSALLTVPIGSRFDAIDRVMSNSSTAPITPGTNNCNSYLVNMGLTFSLPTPPTSSTKLSTTLPPLVKSANPRSLATALAAEGDGFLPLPSSSSNINSEEGTEVDTPRLSSITPSILPHLALPRRPNNIILQVLIFVTSTDTTLADLRLLVSAAAFVIAIDSEHPEYFVSHPKHTHIFRHLAKLRKCLLGFAAQMDLEASNPPPIDDDEDEYWRSRSKSNSNGNGLNAVSREELADLLTHAVWEKEASCVVM